MSAKRRSMVGRKFGLWTVVARGFGYDLLLAHCTCGTKRIVRGTNLRRLYSRSCGAPECKAKLPRRHDIIHAPEPIPLVRERAA